MVGPKQESASIPATMQDEIRKTLQVVTELKEDTSDLLRRTKYIAERLATDEKVERAVREIEREVADIEEDVVDGVERELEREVEDLARFEAETVARIEEGIEDLAEMEKAEMDALEREVADLQRSKLVADISRLCVQEVMKTMNPLIDSLREVVRSHRGEIQHTADVGEKEFVEKLLTQMNLTAGRKRLALAMALKRNSRN